MGHVMDKHYLKNLSYEVLLANAGFNAKQWNLYRIPRSRGTSLNDSFVKILIEFFYPDIYRQCDRARAAYEGRAYYATDAISITNLRFLQTLREITLFWLQDAVLLVERYKNLAGVAPFKTLLAGCYNDSNLMQAYRAFGTIVLQQERADNVAVRQQLLSQEQLYQHVREGATHSARLIDGRLARLPQELSAEADYQFQIRMQEYEDAVQDSIRRTFAEVFERCFSNLRVQRPTRPETRSPSHKNKTPPRSTPHPSARETPRNATRRRSFASPENTGDVEEEQNDGSSDVQSVELQQTINDLREEVSASSPSSTMPSTMSNRQETAGSSS